MTNDQQLTNGLPDIERSNFEKHPKRFLNKKLIAKVVFFIPVLIGIIVSSFFIEMNGFLIYALSAWFVLFICLLAVSYKEFFVRGYVLREHDITYKRGWLFHHQITVPFNRIQHTDVNHGPIDRWFNLCELEIFTAGGSSSDLSISGLDPDHAARIKKYISAKSSLHV